MWLINVPLDAKQFEASDDPLEKVTTAEAIRTLIDYYRTSQYSYAANQKVEEISKVVSSSTKCLILSLYVVVGEMIEIFVMFVYYRKEQC